MAYLTLQIEPVGERIVLAKVAANTGHIAAIYLLFYSYTNFLVEW